MSTFVTVGNATQPFARLLETVALVARRLPAPVRVQYGHTPFRGHAQMEGHPFVPMEDFERLVRQAALVITHAGAGSVICALQARKTPVVMPRRRALGEHVDDHQVELAGGHEGMGRVMVAHDAAQLEDAIAHAMRRQQSPGEGGEARLVRLVDERLQGYLG